MFGAANPSNPLVLRAHESIARRRTSRSIALAAALLSVALLGTQSVHAACTLRVGTSGDYAPFSLRTAAGAYEGLDIEIVRRLAADLDCGVTFVPFTWPELDAQLTAARIDVVASGVTMRMERALIGRFSRPYAITGALLLVRAGDADRLRTLEDCNRPDVRVAVNAGGHLERVARARLPRAAIQPQRDNRSLPHTLRDGRADAVMTDSAEAAAWLAGDFRVIGPFTHDYKALLLGADGGDRAAQIDAWLRAREADGWLGQQRARYLGAAAASAAPEAGREAVAALIRLRLELMPAVGAAKREAGLPLEDKMQERRVLVRVAAQRPAHPERLANVYPRLIEMAKTVQQAHATDPAPASLDALRGAIERIDAQLVREIDQPSQATPAQWQAVLRRAISIAGVDAAQLERLARALADQPIDQPPSHD